MKILHLITSINNGGAENHVADLAMSQSKIGHQVYVYYFKGNGYWKSKLTKNKVKVLKLKKNDEYRDIFYFPYTFLFLLYLIKKYKFNVVHAHLPLMEILASFTLIFFPKIKFIISKHLDNSFISGSNTKENNNNLFLSLFIEKWIINRSHKCIAISSSVKKFFIKNYGVKKNKIDVIYYGIDTKKFQKNSKDKIINKHKLINKNKNFLILGTIARLVEQKNISLILKALSVYKKQGHKFRYYIMGDGPKLKQLVKNCDELGITKEVKFLGYSLKTKSFLQNIDVFCLSSNYEGLGMVLLEAMSTKVPIIATNTSAIPEIVTKKCGLLFKKNDNNDLLRKIKKFSNVKLRKHYATKAYKRVEKYFTLKKCLNKVINLYN